MSCGISPFDAHAKLIEALRVVCDRQASGADDWEYSLLHTFVKYLEAIGVDRDLRDPLWKMYLAKWNEIENARRRKAGKSGTPKPMAETLSMAFAAAAVTVLKGHKDEVLASVARALGIERKKLKSFRDNLNRGLLSEIASKTYQDYVAKLRCWPPELIMKTLPVLRGFVS